MRQYLRNIVFFVMPVLLVLAGLELAVRQVPNDYTYKRDYLEGHLDSIDVLVMGSSHSIQGINPKYISPNAFSLANYSQPLRYDCILVEKYIDRMPNLSTVILPISYHSLWGDITTSVERWRLPYYVSAWGINEDATLAEYSLLLSNGLVSSIKSGLFFLVKGKDKVKCDKLGFAPTVYRNIDLQKSGVEAALRHRKKGDEFLQLNIECLKHCVDICTKNGIEVLLLTTPAYRTYVENIDSLQFLEMEHIIHGLEGVRYLNYFLSEEFDAEDFYDADHLNALGAEKLSNMVKSKISVLKQ